MSLFDDRGSRDRLVIEAPVAQLSQETEVDIVDDFQVSGQYTAKKIEIPFFQSLGHDRVVGVGSMGCSWLMVGTTACPPYTAPKNVVARWLIPGVCDANRSTNVRYATTVWPVWRRWI